MIVSEASSNSRFQSRLCRWSNCRENETFALYWIFWAARSHGHQGYGAFKSPGHRSIGPQTVTQAAWLHVCYETRCSGRRKKSIVSHSYGSRAIQPTTQRLPSQPAVPCPSPIPLCDRAEKSSSSRTATVKPLLRAVPAREWAASSSILHGHMHGGL